MSKPASDNIDSLERMLTGNASVSEYERFFTKSAVLIRDFASRPAFREPLRDALIRGADNIEARLEEGLPSAQESLFFAMVYSWASPEWILPLGFDEMRFNCESVSDPDVSDSSAGVFEEIASEIANSAQDAEMVNAVSRFLGKSPQFRTPNGVWHDMEFVFDKILPPDDESHVLSDWNTRTQDAWLSQLRSKALTEGATVYMPALHTPLANYSEIRMQSAVHGILRAVIAERVALADLHWRRLEEIIAELLHDLGLQVELTPRSHDGGRDVIARGELLPGEPMVLAVEVKQMTVVPVSDVRAALWANRQFPALLLATSGRFSAGVYREKLESDNVLRLHLKDGLALQQWIDSYAQRRGLR